MVWLCVCLKMRACLVVEKVGHLQSIPLDSDIEMMEALA